MKRIAIIGAGNLGVSIASVISSGQKRDDITIKLWDVSDRSSKNVTRIEDAVRDAETVFLCVSSRALRDAAGECVQHADEEANFITLAKGIEYGTKLFAYEVLDNVVGSNRSAIIYGPMLAGEMSQGLPTSALVAGGKEACSQAVDLFETSTINVKRHKDTRGVAACGVLKNVYALGLGMADALGLGANACGVLIDQSVREMQMLVPELGGKEETVYTLAGVGDLVATGTSDLSNNFTAGRTFAREGACLTKSEGMLSLPSLIDMVDAEGDKTPMLKAIKRVVIDNSEAKDKLRELMKSL